MEPLTKGICFASIVSMSVNLMGANPMLRQKTMQTMSAAINSNKISFHREERFEYLNSALSAVIS
jgi:hypothetical protein